MSQMGKGHVPLRMSAGVSLTPLISPSVAFEMPLPGTMVPPQMVLQVCLKRP